MNLGCGRDVWALYGAVFNHPTYAEGDYIFVATPVEYDVEQDIIKTCSGSEYKLVNPGGIKSEIVTEILDVIERGGYSVH